MHANKQADHGETFLDSDRLLDLYKKTTKNMTQARVSNTPGGK